MRRDQLEETLQARDLNGGQLARLVATNHQTINGLRAGKQQRVDATLAAKIERALGVRRGTLFEYEPPVKPAQAAS